MRPLHLSLRDFKSHRHTELPLAGVRAASITGANGAGKSSMLDAIVYALYGPSGLGLRADAIVREGADAATVSLVFSVAGVTYRIVRTRRISGKTVLDLQQQFVPTGEPGEYLDNAWNPLTMGTVDDTQRAIEQLVGANVDTFMRSAFIGQGDAARFAKATPADRKATLVQALDLEQYPPLAQAARDHARGEAQKLAAAQQRIDDLARQLDGRTTEELAVTRAIIVAAIEAGEEARPQLVRQVEADRKAVEDARVAAASGDAARQRAGDLARHVDALLGDVARASELVGQREQALTALVAQASQLETLVLEQPALVDLAPLETAAVDAGGTLEEARTRVTAAAAEVTAQQAAVAAVSQAVSQRELAAGKVKDAVAQIDRLTGEQNAPCPTCDQELGAQARAVALDRLNAERVQLEEQHAARVREAAEAQAKVVPGHMVENARDLAVRAERDAMGSAAAAQKALDDARASNDRHHALTARITSARDAVQHRAAREAELTQAREQHATAVATHAAAKAQLEQARANVADDDSAARIAKLEALVAASAGDLATHDADRARLDRDLAATTERFTHVRGVEEQLARAREAVAPLEAAHERWEVLQRAFGRDGIPAQVIRHAKPQIEQDANDLLAEFGAPYRIRIDLERDTRAGDVRDTLDITILAGDHERPYDLLSGGEQYRVNVALRVAITKVLAHRSGRRIELMVLDEPEGLDVEGFSQLAGVITTLGREVPLVLTVSHSDRLDAVCDTQISVEKDVDGSRITVAA